MGVLLINWQKGEVKNSGCGLWTNLQIWDSYDVSFILDSVSIIFLMNMSMVIFAF